MQIAFVLSVLPIAVTIVVLAIIYRPQGTLSFYELNEDEQDTYMALVNKIETKLLYKFLKNLALSLTLKIGIFLLTGGVSFWFSAVRWLLWEPGKNATAIANTKEYVETRRKKYRRKEIDWDTFEEEISQAVHHLTPSGSREGYPGFKRPGYLLVCWQGVPEMRRPGTAAMHIDSVPLH